MSSQVQAALAAAQAKLEQAEAASVAAKDAYEKAEQALKEMRSVQDAFNAASHSASQARKTVHAAEQHLAQVRVRSSLVGGQWRDDLKAFLDASPVYNHYVGGGVGSVKVTDPRPTDTCELATEIHWLDIERILEDPKNGSACRELIEHVRRLIRTSTWILGMLGDIGAIDQYPPYFGPEKDLVRSFRTLFDRVHIAEQAAEAHVEEARNAF